MEVAKIQPSSKDKKIGLVSTIIGVLWILAIIFIEYGNYSSPLNNRTLGQLMIGIGLNSLIPLLFVSSGQYYLSGGNAKRIANKKGKLNQSTPVDNSATPINSLGSTIPPSNNIGQTVPPMTIPSNQQQPSQNLPHENQP